MTDNTEAVEKLAEIMGGLRCEPFISQIDLNETAQAILAAIQADPWEFVKLKPIKWHVTEQVRAIGMSAQYGDEPEPTEFRCVQNYTLKRQNSFKWTAQHYWDNIAVEVSLEAAQDVVETHRNEMLAKEFTHD